MNSCQATTATHIEHYRRCFCLPSPGEHSHSRPGSGDLDKPIGVAPAERTVVAAVRGTAVRHVGRPWWCPRPEKASVELGQRLAGTVEQVGSGVTAFQPGDEVYGFGHGAFAEYVAVDQGNLAPKPRNLTFAQAAAVPLAAVTALQGLRAGGIQPGQHVLIVGASGGVGTFAV